MATMFIRGSIPNAYDSSMVVCPFIRPFIPYEKHAVVEVLQYAAKPRTSTGTWANPPTFVSRIVPAFVESRRHKTVQVVFAPTWTPEVVHRNVYESRVRPTAWMVVMGWSHIECVDPTERAATEHWK